MFFIGIWQVRVDRTQIGVAMMITFKIVRVPWKDHQSFSFETKLSDEVFRYGENFKYSHEDVKEIIEYARVRGIRARLKHSLSSAPLQTVLQSRKLRGRNKSSFCVAVDNASFNLKFQSSRNSFLSSLHLVTLYLGRDWWKAQFIFLVIFSFLFIQKCLSRKPFVNSLKYRNVCQNRIN